MKGSALRSYSSPAGARRTLPWPRPCGTRRRLGRMSKKDVCEAVATPPEPQTEMRRLGPRGRASERPERGPCVGRGNVGGGGTVAPNVSHESEALLGKIGSTALPFLHIRATAGRGIICCRWNSANGLKLSTAFFCTGRTFKLARSKQIPPSRRGLESKLATARVKPDEDDSEFEHWSCRLAAPQHARTKKIDGYPPAARPPWKSSR